MASVLVETTRGVDGTRVVLFTGVLEPYINDRWRLDVDQAICDWRIGLDGHAWIHGPLRFK